MKLISVSLLPREKGLGGCGIGITPTPGPSPYEGEGGFTPSLTPQKPNLHPSLLSLRFPIKLALRCILAVKPLPPATQKGHAPI